MTRHMVEYLHPGAFLPERSTRELERWYGDHTAGLTLCFPEALEHMPDSAFAFRLYSVEEAPDLGPDFHVTAVAKYHGGRFYVDAVAFTQEDVEALGVEYEVLLSNMEANGWDWVLKCRTGNWQPRNDDDLLIFTDEVDDDVKRMLKPCGGSND